MPAMTLRMDEASSSAAAEARRSAPAEHLLAQLDSGFDMAGVALGRSSIMAVARQRGTRELLAALGTEPFLAEKVLRAASLAAQERGQQPPARLPAAIVALGDEAVEALLAGAVDVSRMKDKAQAQRVRQEMTRMAYAAAIAREIARHAAIDPDDAALAALLKDFGRLVCAAYLYPEFEQALAAAQESGVSADRGAQAVLGRPFVVLTEEIMRRRSAPGRIIEAITGLAAPVSTNGGAMVKLRLCTELATGMAAAMAETRLDVQSRIVRTLLERFGAPLRITRQDLWNAARMAERSTRSLRTEALPWPVSSATGGDDSALVTLSPSNRPAASLALAAGVAKLSRMLEQQAPLPDLLNQAAFTLRSAFDFQRVVVATRQPGTDIFVSASIAGRPTSNPRSPFGFRESDTPDLFNVALAKGVDVYLRNLDESLAQNTLPAWYCDACPDAKSLLILSIMADTGAIGFFYADRSHAGAQRFSREEMDLLRALKLLTRISLERETSAVPRVS